MALTDKLTAIADAIRAKGGTTDLLTLDGMVEAINAISAGGGGFKTASGTYTPASDSGWMVVEFDFKPRFIQFYLDNYDTDGLNGTAKVLCGVYVDGLSSIQCTNAGGSSAGVFSGNVSPSVQIADNDTTILNPQGLIRPRKSGGYNLYYNRQFRAGTTYTWEAFGE